MNNKIVFGQYYNTNSWIHRLDPRSKILVVLIFMIAVFFVESIYTLLGVFGGILLIIITSKIPIGKFLSSIKTVSYLLLFAAVIQILFKKTGEILYTFEFTLTIYNLIIGIVLLVLFFLSSKIIKKFRFFLFLFTCFVIFALQIYFVNGYKITDYKISIHEKGLLDSSFIVLRIIMILLMSSLLTFSTKHTDLNNGLEKLLSFIKVFKLNPAIPAMIMSIALRMIPKLLGEADKVLKAQASRGVDFKEGNLKDKISQIISLLVPMFIISYQISDDLSDAMEARGYDPDSKRSSINILKFKFKDYICIFVNLVMLVLFIVF